MDALDSALAAALDDFQFTTNENDSKQMAALDEIWKSLNEAITNQNESESTYLFAAIHPHASVNKSNCSQQNEDNCFIDNLLHELNEQYPHSQTLTQFISYINQEQYDSGSIKQDFDDYLSSNIIHSLPNGNQSTVDPNNLFQFCKWWCSHSPIKCASLKRIYKILKSYEIFKSNETTTIDIHEAIYGPFDGGYNNVNLLNDFNHLMDYHSEQFEDIYNILRFKLYNDKPCDLANCYMMRRNTRDRMKESLLIRNLYCSDIDEDMMIEQHIDRIHCHYFHTFDIGYRISRAEQHQIISDDEEKESRWNNNKYSQRIATLISNKQKKYRDYDYGRTRSNKFITNEHNMITDRITMNQYRFGFRFFYHEFYKDSTLEYDPVGLMSTVNVVQKHPSNEGYNKIQNRPFRYTLGGLYVSALYHDLKDELVNNGICQININQYINEQKKAHDYLGTKYAKRMFCPRQYSAKYYEMTYGYTLKKSHIIVAMIYCNYDVLQQEFSKTYRRDPNKKDEDITDIKLKHSNYYWFGRYLKECVECFGMDHNEKITLRFYHGINEMMTFETVFAYVKGPFSVSCDYAVAVNFSNAEGIVLELEIDVKSWIYKIVEGAEATRRISCFNMQHWSDYPQEQEVFFVGGLNRFYFNEIHDRSGINYGKYIEGLKQMTSGMTHGGISTDTIDLYIPRTKQETQIVFRLLSHQFWEYYRDHKYAREFKGCPQYIKKLMDSHCKMIRWIQYIDTVPKHKVLDAFFRDDDKYLKLKDLTTIFPNVELIQYFLNNDMCLYPDINDDDIRNEKYLQYIKSDRLFRSVIDFIDGNTVNGKHKYALKRININIKPEFEEEMERFIRDKWEKTFDRKGWEIIVRHYESLKDWSKNVQDIYNLPFDVATFLKAAKDPQNPLQQMVRTQIEAWTKPLKHMFHLVNPSFYGQEITIWEAFDHLVFTTIEMYKSNSTRIDEPPEVLQYGIDEQPDVD